MQRRRQVDTAGGHEWWMGGAHGERAVREPISGSGGKAPSGVQGQSPWWVVRGAKLPEAERVLAFIGPLDTANLHP